MIEHTKEPWYTSETEDGLIEITNDERNGAIVAIAEVSTGYNGQIGIEQDANARRIVACVNRLAPFSTEDIENRAIDLLGGGELVSRVHVYERVIHGLIVALDKIASWNEGEIGGHMDEPVSAGIARKAITAAKGAET